MMNPISGLGGATGGGFSSSSSAATGDLYEAPRSFVGPTINIGSRSQSEVLSNAFGISNMVSSGGHGANINAPVSEGRNATILTIVFVVVLALGSGFLLLRKG